MKVGIVMPTLDQVDFIGAAVTSCEIAQMRAPGSELVIVDDGCTDGTRALLAKLYPRVRVVTHAKNMGSAAAINTGVEALGDGFDALTWISSDNVMSPAWLAELMDAFGRGRVNDRPVGAAYSGFHYAWPDGRRKGHYVFRKHEPGLLVSDPNCYYGPSFLIARDVWLEAGPHRGRISHDYDHWLRVEEACFRRGLAIVGVDKSLCVYNAHDKRATVTRTREYDAPYWQAEARKRRSS